MGIRWDLADKLAEHGITAYRLADLTGLSIQSCYDLARDEDIGRIKASTLLLLCDLFHCEPGELIRRVPDD